MNEPFGALSIHFLAFASVGQTNTSSLATGMNITPPGVRSHAWLDARNRSISRCLRLKATLSAATTWLPSASSRTAASPMDSPSRKDCTSPGVRSISVESFPPDPVTSSTRQSTLPGHGRRPRPIICTYSVGFVVGRALTTQSAHGKSAPSVRTMQFTRAVV